MTNQEKQLLETDDEILYDAFCNSFFDVDLIEEALNINDGDNPYRAMLVTMMLSWNMIDKEDLTMDEVLDKMINIHKRLSKVGMKYNTKVN